MSLAHQTVSVTNVATRLTPVPESPDAYSREVHTVAVQNVSSVDVFIGAAGVTTASYGYKLAAGADIVFDIPRRDALYAIVAAGSASVNVFTARA